MHLQKDMIEMQKVSFIHNSSIKEITLSLFFLIHLN